MAHGGEGFGVAGTVDLFDYVPRHVAEELIRHPDDDPVGRDTRWRMACMFIDISGFSPMSEAFARVGRSGGEELTGVLNGFFRTMIDVADGYGASVGKFGGDALTVVFPTDVDGESEGCRRAVQCALDMQAASRGQRDVDTSAGTFSLSCKIGLGFGDVLSTTVGIPGVRLEYVLAGDAIDRSAAGEHLASATQIVAHEDLVSRCPGISAGERLGDGFRKVEGLEPPARPHRARSLGHPSPELARLLSGYLHPAIAARIGRGDPRFVDEHRVATMLFVRFEGLDYATQRGADELRAFSSEVVRVVADLDGHLQQIDMGDKGSKVLVSFGAAVAHEDDQERAIRCALEIRDLRPGARIGMASGLAFCAEVGNDRRREYATIGDTTNVAARLMEAAGVGQILWSGVPSIVSERRFHLERLAPVSVRGKAQLVPVVEVRGDRAWDDEPLGERAYELAMVGRDEELARAGRVVADAESGAGGVLAITGDPGIGKSRLSAEIARIARGHGFRVHTAACLSDRRATPYLPWRTTLRSLFGIGAGTAAQRVEQVRDELASLDPALVPRAPLLAPVLGLTFEETDLTKGLEPALRAEWLASLVVACLRHWTARVPRLIVLEDLHWMDAASQELLVAVARAVADMRLIVLSTTRPISGTEHAAARTQALAHAVPIDLGPLSASSVEALLALELRELFAIETEPPDELVALVTARAEGNPFFLEEFLRLLRDQGVDPRDEGAFATLELPDSLYRLVLARLDTLSVEDQTTLKVASVIGRRFRASWMGGAYPELGDLGRIRDRLERLAGVQLVEALGTEHDPEYVFRHSIVREAAYDSLSFSLRQDLHGAVGRYIEDAFPGELERFVNALAYHFGESRDVDRQRLYFRKAADAARAAFANAVALDYLERLVPLVSGAQASEAMRDLGELQQLVGAWAEAEGSFRRAIEDAGHADARLEQARAECSLGYLLAHSGSLAEALELLEDSERTFRRQHDVRWRLRALEYLAYTAWQQTDYDGSLRYSDLQLALAEHAGDAVAACMAIESSGLVHWHRGEQEQARASFERALAEADTIGYERGVIHASNDLAGLHVDSGDHTRAFECLMPGLEAAREIGDRHAEGVMIGNAGELYRIHGDLTRAIACAVRGLSITTELRDWPDVVTKLGNIAVALADQGRADEAERFSNVAIALARATDDDFTLCECLLARSSFLADPSAMEEALRLSEEAAQIAERIARPDVHRRASIRAIDLRHRLGSLGTSEALSELDRLEDVDTPIARADCDFARWQLLPDDERFRERARDACLVVLDRTPNAECRSRLLALTGQDAPEPDPLPDVGQGQITRADLTATLLTGQALLREWRAGAAAEHQRIDLAG